MAGQTHLCWTFDFPRPFIYAAFSHGCRCDLANSHPQSLCTPHPKLSIELQLCHIQSPVNRNGGLILSQGVRRSETLLPALSRGSYCEYFLFSGMNRIRFHMIRRRGLLLISLLCCPRLSSRLNPYRSLNLGKTALDQRL